MTPRTAFTAFKQAILEADPEASIRAAHPRKFTADVAGAHGQATVTVQLQLVHRDGRKAHLSPLVTVSTHDVDTDTLWGFTHLAQDLESFFLQQDIHMDARRL